MHAHPPAEAAGAEDRRPVHRQTPVRPPRSGKLGETNPPGKIRLNPASLSPRFLVKLQEFNYQIKVKAVFDK